MNSLADKSNIKEITMRKNLGKEENSKTGKKNEVNNLDDKINDFYNYFSKLNILLENTKDKVFNIPKKKHIDEKKMNKKMIIQEKKIEDERIKELNNMNFFIKNTFDHKVEELFSIEYSNNNLDVLKNSICVDIGNVNEILTNLIKFKLK
jgi:hypothetical protein